MIATATTRPPPPRDSVRPISCRPPPREGRRARRYLDVDVLVSIVRIFDQHEAELTTALQSAGFQPLATSAFAHVPEARLAAVVATPDGPVGVWYQRTDGWSLGAALAAEPV